MSVLIKGLNIKPCKDGFGGKGLVIIGYDDKLYAVAHEQIIPLPDHGDLIDRDEVAKLLGVAESCGDCQYSKGIFCERGSEFVNACEAVYDAEVIIYAESSEDGET